MSSMTSLKPLWFKIFTSYVLQKTNTNVNFQACDGVKNKGIENLQKLETFYELLDLEAELNNDEFTADTDSEEDLVSTCVSF